jgi:hypothetical protein
MTDPGGDTAMDETKKTKTLLCGSCHVRVKPRINLDGHTLLVCPKCGESDTPENVVREASRYLVDKTMREGMRNYRFIFGD